MPGGGQEVASKALSQLREQFWSFYWLVRCYLYVILWGVNLTARRRLTDSAAVALAIANFWLLIEIVIAFVGAPVHLLVTVPWWVGIPIVFAAFLMFRHRTQELKELRRKPVLATTLRHLLFETAALDFHGCNAETAEKRLDEYLWKVFYGFCTVFSDEIPDLNINVMLLGEDGRLRVRYSSTGDGTYDPNFSLAPGEGGAGLAFQQAVTVYIPAVKYRHGIKVVLPLPKNEVTLYDLVQNAYRRTEPEPFACIVSAPVRSSTDVLAVLNMDCRQQDVFREFDLQLAEVAAGFVGLALDKRRTTLVT